MRNMFLCGLAIGLLLCLAGVSQAISVTLVDENFDSMGSAAGSITSPPAGWTVGFLGAVGSQNRLAMSPYAGNGQSITSLPIYSVAGIGNNDYRTVYNGGTLTDVGHVYNCGVLGATDRALGNYPRTNPSGDHVMQVAFSNTTGAPISSIQLDYDMEQWGQAQGNNAGRPELIRVLLSSTSATDGFTYMGTAFDGVAPLQGAASPFRVIDGNANMVHVSGVYALPAPLDPGASMYLRFHDWNDDATSDHLLAIDNVKVTTEAVPEPSTIALALAGLMALAVGYIRRK